MLPEAAWCPVSDDIGGNFPISRSARSSFSALSASVSHAWAAPSNRGRSAGLSFSASSTHSLARFRYSSTLPITPPTPLRGTQRTPNRRERPGSRVEEQFCGLKWLFLVGQTRAREDRRDGHPRAEFARGAEPGRHTARLCRADLIFSQLNCWRLTHRRHSGASAYLTAFAIAARTASASAVPSASPFSKSAPAWPIVLVTCAMHSTLASRAFANV